MVYVWGEGRLTSYVTKTLAKWAVFENQLRGFIGDYDTFQLLRDSFVNHLHKDPYQAASILESTRSFFAARFQG